MAKYRLTRNQAFPDLAAQAGDIIEVDKPGSPDWKPLIDANILRPIKDKTAPANAAAPELPDVEDDTLDLGDDDTA